MANKNINDLYDKLDSIDKRLEEHYKDEKEKDMKNSRFIKIVAIGFTIDIIVFLIEQASGVSIDKISLNLAFISTVVALASILKK